MHDVVCMFLSGVSFFLFPFSTSRIYNLIMKLQLLSASTKLAGRGLCVIVSRVWFGDSSPSFTPSALGDQALRV